MFWIDSSQILYTITTLFIVIVIGSLLLERKKPSSIVAWIFLIITLPYIGIILYLIFHGRKMKNIINSLNDLKVENIIYQKKELDNSLERFIYNDSEVYPTYNKRFYLCKDSVDSFKSLKEMLLSAKESIYICTYIFGKDEVTTQLLDILSQKSKEGVEVKLLIDSLGSFSLEINPKILEPLSSVGVEYKFFMSILKKPFSSKLNLRNHRKMIIVDHTTVMSGGINISKEYLCDLDEAWVDISFIIEGAAALEYEQVFWHNWFIQDEMPRVDLKYQGLKVESGSSILQVVPSGPDLERDTLYEATIYAIHQAKSRIWIVTPYFAPQDTLLDALIIALHRGVEVVILSPLNSDHLLLDITKSAFLRELEAEGAQIFLYKRTMLHAKAILIDSELAIMGSANFDARSYFYNFEIVSFVYSKRDILMLIRWIEELFSGCEYGVKKASKVQILFENFFKIFAPAL